MDTSSTMTTFPRLSSGYYWKIWDQFQKRMPSVLDASSFSYLGDFSEKSFRTNVFAHLKLMGFVGEGDKPSDLAFKWRNPDTHREACEEIINAVYPSSLLDAFPDADTPMPQLTRWFQNHARQGEKTAEASARMLSLLKTSDPENRQQKTERPTATSVRSTSKRRTNSSSGPQGSSVESGDSANEKSNEVSPPEVRHRGNKGPSIHLDVQFHLSPEMSAEQIDQVFESMARHLKGWAVDD